MASSLTKNPTTTTTADVKREAHTYMNKLLDRDTEALAASHLESMARSLPSHSLPTFLSAISDTRPSDKTPLRRHCVRLLSLLSLSHPPHSLSPLLPRMLSAVTRRLRDPDSSVRSACVDSVRAITTALSPTLPSSAFLRPLSEPLLLEQDHHAQMGSALCLAAAVDCLPRDDPDRCPQLQRLLPRLVKLARSDAFKVKPALLGLIGAVVAGGGAGTAALMAAVVTCLVEFLSAEDWAARKAAADALCRVASGGDARLLVGFKAGCLANCEACKFDKVKTVRESMNQMMEAWKEIPDKVVEEERDDGNVPGLVCVKEINSDGNLKKGCKPSNVTRSSSITKSRYSTSRSPPRDPSPVPLTQRNTTPIKEKRSSSPLLRKLDHNKDTNLRTEVAFPEKETSKTVHEDKQQKSESNARSLTGINVGMVDKTFKEEVVKSDYIKAGAKVVPSNEKECSHLPVFLMDETCKGDMETDDLCLIRRQLVQIENQQSNLIDMMQKFMGSSKKGMQALEKRVNGLEIALDEISHEMSIPTGRIADAELSANRCCSLPGTEFLSSKFWKRTEGRYSSRFLHSSSRTSPGIHSSDKPSIDPYKWDKQQYEIQSGYLVNPLANSCSRDNSDTGSGIMLKKAGYVSGYSLRDCRMFDGASTSSCSSVAGIHKRST